MQNEREVLIIGGFAVWVLICISLAAGAVYVAIHFITKFW